MQFADQQLQIKERRGRVRTRFIVLIAAICVGALVLFNTPSKHAEADAVDAPAANTAEPTSPSTIFEYFPAQYRNSAQGSMPEEHIQAF